MEINAYSINMGDKNRKEPTWKEALREAGKQTKKRLLWLKNALLGKKLQCPCCFYSTKSEKAFHYHLTYSHWLSPSTVDQIIEELAEG